MRFKRAVDSDVGFFFSDAIERLTPIFQLLINHRPLFRRRRENYRNILHRERNPSPLHNEISQIDRIKSWRRRDRAPLLDNETTTAGGRKLFIEAIVEAISDDDTLNFAPCRPVYRQMVLNHYPIHVTLTR